MKLTAILAINNDLLIWSNQKLPWNCKEDLKRFKEYTTGKHILMWRKTYASLPIRPLPNRHSIIISSKEVEWIETYSNINDFVDAYKDTDKEIVVIWGATIYNQFFEQNLIETVILTVIEWKHDGDIFINEFRHNFNSIVEDKWEWYTFYTLNKKPD